LFSLNGIHSGSHNARSDLIGHHIGKRWQTEYERLRTRTRAYRYECERPSQTDIDELLSKSVRPFIVHLCKALSPPDSGTALLKDLKPRGDAYE